MIDRRGTTRTDIWTRSPFHGYNQFANFSKGDIVPLFGYLYRVTGTKGHVLKWIPDDVAPKELRVRYDSKCIPLRRGGVGLVRAPFSGRLPNNARLDLIGLEVIERRKTGGRSTNVAKLWLRYTRRRDKKIEVRTGDVLTFGARKWIIRNIVPRDEKRGSIGWVEIGRVRPEPRAAVVLRKDGRLTIKLADPKSAPKSPDAWLAKTFKDKDGRLWLEAMWTRMPRPEIVEACKNLGTVMLGCTPLTVGDLVPVYGRLYKVAELKKDSITFRKALAAEVPDRAAPKPGTLLISFHQSRAGTPGVSSEELMVYPQGLPYIFAEMYDTKVKGVGVVPRVQLYGKPDELSAGLPAKVGGRYGLLRSFDVEVVNVVKPDLKRGIIGWVELKPLVRGRRAKTPVKKP
ncbi:MAG: hypothetical protein ACE5KM_17760 [Planctomycetaceae bacterium]